MNSLFDGLRVVEAATVVMVPSAGALLADFGAEVIKVEQTEGDTLRHLHQITGMPESEIAYCHLQVNRNKKSIVLDLKQREGLDILLQLIERADVFLTNYRPQALAKLGLRFDDVKSRNPRLIYAYGTGYGEEGPESTKPGYDTVCYFARSGFEATVFPHEGWLGHFPPAAGDHPTGMALFSAILMALLRRERTGEGAKVSTSLIANGAWANSCLIQAQLCGATFLEKRPRERSHNFTALHYRGKDGGLFRLTIVNVERDWPVFCRALELEDLIDDPRFRARDVRREHMPELIAILDQAFAQHDRAYWMTRLEKFDIPHSLSAGYAEIAADEQMKANGVFVEYEHPKYGAMQTVNNPLHVSGIEKTPPKAAPELGEHTREILTSLGYPADEISALLKSSIAE